MNAPLALSNTVNICMGNHFYLFGGSLHRQTDGGAIGSSLTGEVARDVMGVGYLIFEIAKKTGNTSRPI